MALLSILYGQTKVVINDQSGSNETGLKGRITKLKRNVLQEIGAYAGIVLDCTTIEDHNYTAAVTQNPIEDGSTISDHVNLQPVTITVEGLVSDSPLGFALIGTAQNVANQIRTLFGTQSRSKTAFDEIIKLWKNRIPFTVLTNLKRYDNMVISSANFPFSNTTGKALDLKIEFTQLSIVKSRILESTPQDDFNGKTKNLKDYGAQTTSTAEAGSAIQEAAKETSAIKTFTQSLEHLNELFNIQR